MMDDRAKMSMQRGKFETLPLLATLREILQNNFMMPRENDSFYDRTRIFKLILPFIFGGIPYFIGTTGYLYFAFTRNLWPQQMNSLLFLAQEIAAISVLTVFVCTAKYFVISLERISTYVYGAPSGSIEVIHKINKICLAFFYFLRVACVCQAMVSLLFQSFCNDPSFSEETGYVCGSYAPLWYPFRVDYPLLPTIIRICVIWNSAFYLPMFCITIVSPMTKSYIILMRIEELGKLFRNFNKSQNEITLKELKALIEYHAEIRECISLLNTSLGYIHLPVQILMPVVIALYTYQVYLTYDMFALIGLITWIFPYFTLCLLGERLKNESSNLSDIAYDIKWYNIKNKHVKVTYKLFLHILSVPVELKLKPMGALNHLLFIKIVKTTYSCVLFFFDKGMK